MYQIKLRRRAQRALDKLPKNDFKAVVQTIKDLAETPRPRGIEKVKNTGLWRVRQGDYQIIYAIDDKKQVITILLIGHRRDIYRAI